MSVNQQRHPIRVTLDAVIVAIIGGEPHLLTVSSGDSPTLPFGRLQDQDRTLERAVRRWVTAQTGLQLGYVEQLYTFGDQQRGFERDRGGGRTLSVAYLALVTEQDLAPTATWDPWYRLLPWEDRRVADATHDGQDAAAALRTWAGDDPILDERIRITFGLDGAPWDGVQVLERYELLYEAGLVAEAGRDAQRPGQGSGFGVSMGLDHRRIAATALGRLRGKLTYRPVVFEMLAPEFTLGHLQRVVESLAGTRLHTQNFRRLVEKGGLVEPTGQVDPHTGGRPAKLYRFRREVLAERPSPGVGHPW
ncbi:MAG: NAD regulator [Acidimicrobiia bacterium]|nr:NAD regulator [Acidimicrobiia bacterium]